jgi:hypothetical protein
MLWVRAAQVGATSVALACSHLQVAFEFVKKTPVRMLGDELLRGRFDHAEATFNPLPIRMAA